MTVTFETERAIEDYYYGSAEEELRPEVAKLVGTGFLPGMAVRWKKTLMGNAMSTPSERSWIAGFLLSKYSEERVDLNQCDGKGEPPLFKVYDRMIFRCAEECGANPNMRDKQGRSCWRAFVAALNTNIINDLPEKRLSVLVECMRLTRWEDNLETRRELMAFESIIPSYWKTNSCCWDELWGKGSEYNNTAFEYPNDDVTGIYKEAYAHGLLFITLPCHHSGRQYWEAYRKHMPIHRVSRVTPPLFGILLLCCPRGRAQLTKWIECGQINPCQRNKDGKNMLYAAVLAGAGEAFCQFLEKRGVALDCSNGLLSSDNNAHRRLMAAACLATTPLELGMLLTLYGRHLPHAFWREQIERIGLVSLLIIDHFAVDVSKILSNEAVASLSTAAHEAAVWTLLTHPQAPAYSAVSEYVCAHPLPEAKANELFQTLLCDDVSADRAYNGIEYLISMHFQDAAAPERNGMYLKDYFLLKLMEQGAPKEKVDAFCNSYFPIQFIAKVISFCPELSKNYFPCCQWTECLKGELRCLVDQAYGDELASFPPLTPYLAPILLKNGEKQALGTPRKLFEVLKKETDCLTARENVLARLVWGQGLFADLLKEDAALWLSAFRHIVPSQEQIDSLVGIYYQVYRQVLTAYHETIRGCKGAFDNVKIEEFLDLCCQRAALGPLLPEPAWSTAWQAMAEKHGRKLVAALFLQPAIARALAENYLFAEKLSLCKGGRSDHKFSCLAVPFLKGFLKNYYHSFRRKFEHLYLHADIAGATDDLPSPVAALAALEAEKVGAFALGHILFCPLPEKGLLEAFRFGRPDEPTDLQVSERLNSAVYRHFFAGPRALEGGFYWVKKVPKWAKAHLKDRIRPHGPYLITCYIVEAALLEQLTDPSLDQERFQALRRDILAAELELICNNMPQRASLGGDTLLLDMLHLEVDKKKSHLEEKYYNFPIGGAMVELHRGGARAMPRQPSHPLDGRMLGHSSFLLPGCDYLSTKQWDEWVDGRYCYDNLVLDGRYLKARVSMNSIARLLRQDAYWLLDRLKACHPLNFNDEGCITWLAKELERGAAQVLAYFSGDEQQSRRFCQDGPFHWEQAARQLLYWHTSPRADLPQDLYPTHVDVEADSLWDGLDGPEPCLALEEIWYHLSFFGYILGSEK